MTKLKQLQAMGKSYKVRTIEEIKTKIKKEKKEKSLKPKKK
jgi:hypothetical protein